MTTSEQDKEAIVSIVKEMAESMSGAQSTRHWAADALWFDIPPFASKGVQLAFELFDKTFANFESCNIEILELERQPSTATWGSSAPFRARTSCSRAVPRSM